MEKKQIIELLSQTNRDLDTPIKPTPLYIDEGRLKVNHDYINLDEKRQIVQIIDKWYHQLQIDNRTKLLLDRDKLEYKLKELL